MHKFTFQVIMGFIFSAIGMVTLLLLRQPLTSAIWLSFGNGLILTDLRFSGTDERGSLYVKPVPPARLYIGIGLIVLAVLLLALQVFLDFQEAGTAK